PRHHTPPPSFPTRRSSDLIVSTAAPKPKATRTPKVGTRNEPTLNRIGCITSTQAYRRVAPGVTRALPASQREPVEERQVPGEHGDRKSTRLNSSHVSISYA